MSKQLSISGSTWPKRIWMWLGGNSRQFPNERSGHAALVAGSKQAKAGAVDLRSQWRLRAGIVGEPG